MPAYRKHLLPSLLSLALGATLVVHSRAEARRLEATVIVGRVTFQGRPVAGAAISVAGRSAHGASAVDGRYSISVARSSESERITLLARRNGYELWQSAVTLRGDTIRVDIRLLATTMLEDSMAPTTAAVRKDVLAAPAPVEQRVGEARAKSVTGAVAANAPYWSASPAIGRSYRRDVDVRRQREPGNTEAYDRIDENPFRSPTVAPLSTFSVDVDRASYSNVRRFLDHGSLPPKDAVRIEELVNYFPYADAAPARGDVPLRVTTEVAAAPWNTAHDLVRIALRARDVDMRRAPAANLVFLIDVSGSMMGPGRLPLVKQSLALLVNQLREEDRVAIVVYAGNAGLVLPSTSGSDKQRILAALDGLEAGGSTAGGAGIRLAYDVARQNFIRGGSNRVILCTDGDFNVGQSSDGALVDLIEQRRTEGAFLTILGFGMGN
jgi:Ca-activated chloride channel family protein